VKPGWQNTALTTRPGGLAPAASNAAVAPIPAIGPASIELVKPTPKALHELRKRMVRRL
jgi:hypothetical protein